MTEAVSCGYFKEMSLESVMLTQSRWFQEHGSSLSGASEPHVPLTLRSHCPHIPTVP